MAVTSYYVQTRDKLEEFEVLGEALNRARGIGQMRAMMAAVEAGADNPQVLMDVDSTHKCNFEGWDKK